MRGPTVQHPGDGKGLRKVYVNGKLITHVFEADPVRGVVVAAKQPIRLDRWRKRVLTETLRGTVVVEPIKP